MAVTIDMNWFRRAAVATIAVVSVCAPMTTASAARESVASGIYSSDEAARGDDSEAMDQLKPGQVVTVAGKDRPGNSGDGKKALAAELGGTAISEGMRIDVADDGTVYIADTLNDRIRVIDSDGVIDTIAQTEREAPPDDDFEDAADVDEYYAYVFGTEHVLRSVAVGPDGTVYGSAINNIFQVGSGKNPRKNVDTLGGNGEKDFYRTDDGGDGGPVADARIHEPSDLAVGDDGTIYIADTYADRIRKIDADGVLTTIAGGGDVPLAEAAGGRATKAEMEWPESIAVDSRGDVYFALAQDPFEDGGSQVWKIDADGTLTSVAGNGEKGVAGDGGPATKAQLGGQLTAGVSGLAVDADDNLYIADQGYGLVRKVDADGTITTIGPTLRDLYDLAVGPDGLIYVTAGSQVKALNPLDGDAGRGDSAGAETGEGSAAAKAGPDPWADEEPGTIIGLLGDRPRSDGDTAGDGDLFIDTALEGPHMVEADAAGNLYVSEGYDGTLVMLQPDGGVGDVIDELDGEYVTKSPMAMASGADGSLYAAVDGQVVRVYPDGAEVVIAGGGAEGSNDPPEDGQLATTLALNPIELAASSDGTVYIGDQLHGRVYRLERDGTLTTVYSDVSNPNSARPPGFAVAADSALYVAVPSAHRVDRVDPDGSVSAFAGTDDFSDGPYSARIPGPEEIGDGGLALEAVVRSPDDVAVGPDGSVYISTRDGIRRVDAEGTISTLEGVDLDGDHDVSTDFSGSNIAMDPHGNLYVADGTNDQVWVAVRPGEIAESESSLLWLAGAGAALVVLAGVGAVVWRRRRSGASRDAALGSAEPASI